MGGQGAEEEQRHARGGGQPDGPPVQAEQDALRRWLTRPSQLHGLVARFIERPSTWGYLGQLFAISGWTSLPWLGSLRQPTLVLAGDDDPIVPLVNGRILARCIPNARLHVVRGGGHLFLLEQPARIAAVIADYPKGDVGDDLEARPPTD